MRHSNVSTAIISTLGLGSCVGITCYDPAAKVGGLLHAMLPDSKKHRATNPAIAMYLDIALPALVNSTIELGGNLQYLEFKVFGGAQILQSNDYFSIGRQNVEMVKQLAATYRLKVKAWDVGGQLNRSIDLNLRDGKVRLRMPSRQEAWL